jgi:hypothetical protein
MIFISYSHKDDKAAGALSEQLQAARYSTFLAHDDVEAASDWHAEILEALNKCHAFVGLLTDDFNDSPFCQQEVGAALALEKPHVLVVESKKMRAPGFAARFQTVKRNKFLDTLNESSKFRGVRAEAWIEANVNARSYEEANLIHRRFWQEWDDMRIREKLSWLIASANNSQVSDEGFRAGPFFTKAMRDLRPHLTKKWVAQNDSSGHLKRILRKLHED